MDDFVVLLVLWMLGLVSGHTIGGFIHVARHRSRCGVDQDHSGLKTDINELLI